MTSLAAPIRELADAADAAELAAILGRVAVPTLGDLCTVYVLDAAGALRPVLSPGGPPTTALRQLYDHETRADQATAGHTRIMLAGRLRVLTDPSDAELGQLANGPDHLALLRAVGFTSILLAPLTTRGQGVGLLVIGSTSGPRRYDADALSLIELLAAVTASTLTARDLAQREATLRRRLDELSLAARELAHLLNNDLTLPIGSVEILLDQSDLPTDTREMLVAAASDLTAAERHIRAFHQLVRGETPSGERPVPPGPPPLGEASDQG